MRTETLTFLNDVHQQFFYDTIKQYHIDLNDSYRVALFYVLGLHELTRSHIRDIYDFELDQINPECLAAPFQTSSSVALIQFAYVLYNDFEIEIENGCSKSHYPSMLQMFAPIDRHLFKYLHQAVDLRFELLHA